jgi:hypothetical protein
VNLAASGISVGSGTNTNFVFGANSILGATYTSGTSTLGGQITFTTGGPPARNNTFDVAAGATLNISNATNGGSSLNTVVRKTGTGTLNLGSLTGNAISASAFNVLAGTLFVSNTSNSATGATVPVAISAGATLAGTGRITGTTSISGILAPGNSIGTMTINNDVTWNGGASPSIATDWKFELGAGNTADLLNLTDSAGEFLKGTGTAFRFDFQGSTALGTFKVVDWTSTASVGGGVLGTSFLASDFSYTNLGGGNIGTFQFNGSQLEFVSVIPEPSASLLLIGVASAVLVRRRRRSD